MCGEKEMPLPGATRDPGSPPRVRGKGPAAMSRTAWAGITPACAGKSELHGLERFLRKDHPRVCGEKCTSDECTLHRRGSPPRVRGKVTLARSAPIQYGITPACAGKSCTSLTCSSCYWDHPRVCGEKNAYQREFLHEKGSPPRVRGKETMTPFKTMRVRITPACAGKRTCWIFCHRW